METKEAFDWVFSKENPDLHKLSAKFHPRFKIWKFRLGQKLISEKMKEKILLELDYKQIAKAKSATWKIPIKKKNK